MRIPLILILCLLLERFLDVATFRMMTLSKPKTLLRRLMVTQKDIHMPALSSTMKEGKIVSWNKKVGEKVQSGEVLLVVESDKADMDVESFEDGYLAAIYTPAGGSAAVGAVVASLVENAGDVSKVQAPGASAPLKTTEASIPTPSSQTPANANTPTNVDFQSILMPALSSTMKEGKIVSWSKKIGDKVSSGDMVLVVESDKADMDVESYEEGFLAAILVNNGEIAPVGSPVAYLAKSKEQIAEIQAFVKSGGQPTASAPSEKKLDSTKASGSSAPAASSAPVVVNDGRVAASGYAKQVAKEKGVDLRTVNPSRPDQYIVAQDVHATGSSSGAGGEGWQPAAGVIPATPLAKKLAQENNLDITKIQGTGNFGRVTPEDVLKAAGKFVPPKTAATPAAATPAAPAVVASGKPAAAAVTTAPEGIVEMTAMQKAVVKNMEVSLSVPVFRVSREICTDRLDELYAQLKPKGVTVSAMIAKAVALALEKHPLINAVYKEGGKIQYNKDINIAMAVAIDNGLITPVIQKCQELDLFSIGRKWKELIEKAKSKKLTPAEYSSGTITISNLGMFGVNQFDAILPPNMGSILAISSSLPRVVPAANGFFSVKKLMTVTITADHRHIYGAHAAEFLKDLSDIIENNVQQLTMG